jgi:hypothetical protein
VLITALTKKKESLEHQISLYEKAIASHKEIESLLYQDGSLKQATIGLMASIYLFLTALKTSLGDLIKK